VEYGTNLLRARRLVEKGVRFVHVISGSPDDSLPDWDAHNNIEKNHGTMAKLADKPIAGLLADLEARGLLKDTLVVMDLRVRPYALRPDRRRPRPNPWASPWIAGGGIKAGYTHGATDEIGLRRRAASSIPTICRPRCCISWVSTTAS
jgi:hypothetical protein